MKCKTLFKSGVLLVLFIYLTISSSYSKSSSSSNMTIKPKSIAIFKNGIGFFIKSGKVNLTKKWVEIDSVPSATLGSFWIYSLSKDLRVLEAVSYWEEDEKKEDVATFAELLKANIGNSVVIKIEDKTYEGKVKTVLGADSVPTQERRYNYYAPPREGSEVIVIDDSQKKVVLNIDDISVVEFPGKFVEEVDKKTKEKKIKLKLDIDEGSHTINVAYIQKGISWTPSYLVDIKDKKKARITMKAVIINDIEDLKDVDVSFVVGYPNFMYTEILSPMALVSSVEQFMSELSGTPRRKRDYSMMTQVMSREKEEISGDVFNYSSIKSVSGTPEEDLFLYDKKNVILKKGERAYYNIFSALVDYEHVYEWKIPDTNSVDNYGQRSRRDTKDDSQVWHSIKLMNSTEYPWTTAPAFTVKGENPLAQDMIKYTPKGIKTNLKLTIATDIKTNTKEYEVERESDISINNRKYGLVTIEGELNIKNRKNKNVTLEIRKRITGEVSKVSHSGKIDKIVEGLKGVNDNSVITWKIPVKKEEEVKITYSYKTYVN